MSSTVRDDAPIRIQLDGRRAPELLARLGDGWANLLAAGGIAYDPSHARSFRHESLAFHYIPGRGSRPGTALRRTAGGLLRPHEPCPFDDESKLAAREILQLGRDGRRYHFVTNRFPVKSLHFLLIRDVSTPADQLPQCLLGPEEIEDALRLARMIGPGLRLFFNSNAGTDGSDSGSTVNHWHFQLFPQPEGPVTSRLERRPDPGSAAALEVGTLPHWDIPHRYYRSADLASIAARLWKDVERVIELDAAFNAEIGAASGDGADDVMACMFPRAPTAPTPIPGIGELSARFGGWELSGDVVIYDPDVYEWAEAHREKVFELAWRRMRGGTRDIWE